jgi:hypothetical protein
VREADAAGGAVNEDRLFPRRAVGAHLEMKVVVAREAKLCAPGEGILIQ